MSSGMKKITTLLFVLFAIGNCAPQKDNVSIAPIKQKQQVSYELVNSDLESDRLSNPIDNDPPITTSSTSSTEAPKTTTTAATTTVAPTANTTTVSPETTTTAPNTTVTPTTLPTTTVPDTTVPTPTTTPSTAPTTTAVPTTPTTPIPQPSTTTQKPEPVPCRRFDGPSFIGGIVLTVGLIAISFVVWKFYKSRTERNYHTL